MTEQLAFNIYSYAVVGILGNALIGWELGRKGWIGLGLEGPKNKKVSFAIFSFILMMIWQSINKLDSPFTSWKDLWIPVWGFLVYAVSYYLVPRSMRLYNQAKFLHESTPVGDWLMPVHDIQLELLRTNQRLLKAEALYIKALEIQKSLSEHTQTDIALLRHQQNVVITYLQLALLYLQQRHFIKATEMTEEAIKIGEALNIKFPNNHEILSSLSLAFFRTAEVEQVQGRLDGARTFYKHSLAIDMNLHEETEINMTMSRLTELEKLEPGTTSNE